MLQENQSQNQEKLASFENLKSGLTSMIESNDLKPETAHLLKKVYGKKLSKTDLGLYSDLSSLASTYVIIEVAKIRLKQGLITLNEIQVLLKNFGPIIKIFEPELYNQLQTHERSFEGAHK